MFSFGPFRVDFCVWYNVRMKLNSFVCGYPVFSTLFVKKTVLFALNNIDSLVKSHLTIHARACFWALDSILLIYISVLMPVTHRLL